MRLPAPLLALGLASLTLAAEAPVADPATLPYRAFSELLAKTEAVRNQDRIEARIRVTPKDPADTAPIRLRIRSRSGEKAIEVARDGTLVDFPVTPELKEENPPVVADRPKGSLQLGVRVSLKRPSKAADETAGWYRKGLDQANASARKLGGALGFMVPRSKSILVEFPKASKGRVVVTAGGVETSYEADAEGRVGVPMEDRPADSRIRFEPEPTAILPD